MAPKQPAHIGIGRLVGTQFQAQQVDQQQILLGHQLLQGGMRLGAEHLVGIEHQHPVTLHMVEGFIAGRRKVTRPGDVVHHGTTTGGNRHSVIH